MQQSGIMENDQLKMRIEFLEKELDRYRSESHNNSQVMNRSTTQRLQATKAPFATISS